MEELFIFCTWEPDNHLPKEIRYKFNNLTTYLQSSSDKLSSVKISLNQGCVTNYHLELDPLQMPLDIMRNIQWHNHCLGILEKWLPGWLGSLYNLQRRMLNKMSISSGTNYNISVGIKKGVTPTMVMEHLYRNITKLSKR